MSPSETDSEHQNDDSVAPDPRLTQLIAYLDGELPAEESEVMERELATEPALRQAADSLDRTWQMLGALEEASASGEFTKKTLTSIRTVSSTDTPRTLPLGKAQSRLHKLLTATLALLLWTFAGFVGCSAGLLLVRNAPASATPDEELLKNLDLLLDYQNMRQIPDARFLQQLAENQTPKTETQP